ELLLKTGGQVGVGVLLELLKFGEQHVARRQYVAAKRGLAVLVTAALARPRQTAIADKLHEARFPSVVIGVAERLLERDLPAEAANGIGVGKQVVAAGNRILAQCGELMQPLEHASDGRRAIEGRPVPRLRKVAPFGE